MSDRTGTADASERLPGSTAGIDWASDRPRRRDRRRPRRPVDRFTSPTPRPGCASSSRRLRRAGVAEVAIERPDGPVVDALLEAELTVFVIAPNQLKNLRSRYGSAGNKDDRFDAYVLADTLRTDRARLRPLTRDSDATITLRMTVRARQDLVHARVAMANQLRAHLQTTLPGAIGLFRDIDSSDHPAVPDPLPQPGQGRLALPARLGNWLRSVGYNHLANLDRLWDHLARRTARHHRTPSRRPRRDHPGAGRCAHQRCAPRSRPSRTRSPTSSPPTPTPRSSPRCPSPAPSAPPGSWPRSATPAAASPPQKHSPASPAPHPRPNSPARSKSSPSAGPSTNNSAAPSSTSPATPTTPTPGPPTSTAAPEHAATTTPTPSASSPAPGSTSSGDAGKTTCPTTPTNTTHYNASSTQPA